MKRPIIATVTGYTRNAELLAQSMAPLCELKRRGVIDRVISVTWDKAELDAHLTPLESMPEIELIRVPEPHASGTPYQKGVVYQVRNLEAALEEVPEEDALILKWRPEFVGDAEFLHKKIVNFDAHCALGSFPLYEGIGLPPSPFKARLWVPWADANQPFFYEDAAFMGLKCDVAKLVTPRVGEKLSPLATKTNTHGPFAHVVRYATIFASDYPIFRRYLREYKYFTNDMDYRDVLITRLMKEAFYWQLLVSHAWVLATCFHVDCGRAGQLRLYPNIYNADSDWSSLAALKINPPFDKVDNWRTTLQPGNLLSGVARLYGRLVDDSWQHALFKDPALVDISCDQVRAMLRNASVQPKGNLAQAEEAYYRTLASTHKDFHRKKQAA